jgi:hypothetical protein
MLSGVASSVVNRSSALTMPWRPPVGAEQQDHHSGRHIAQRPLQGQADGQGGGAQQGEDRGGLHAELLQHRDQADDDHHIAGQRRAEALQGGVGIGCVHPADGAAHQPGHPSGRPQGDGQDQGGDHQVHSQLGGVFGQSREHGLVETEVAHHRVRQGLGNFDHGAGVGFAGPRVKLSRPGS